MSAATFFPDILMGIFGKRMNMPGAVAGMTIGLGFTGLYILYFKYLGGTPDQYLFGISPEGIGTIGMMLNFAVSLVVSRLTPPPPPEVGELIDYIRQPE